MHLLSHLLRFSWFELIYLHTKYKYLIWLMIWRKIWNTWYNSYSYRFWLLRLTAMMCKISLLACLLQDIVGFTLLICAVFFLKRFANSYSDWRHFFSALNWLSLRKTNHNRFNYLIYCYWIGGLRCFSSLKYFFLILILGTTKLAFNFVLFGIINWKLGLFLLRKF